MVQCVPCLGYKYGILGMDRQTPYKADAAECIYNPSACMERELRETRVDLEGWRIATTAYTVMNNEEIPSPERWKVRADIQDSHLISATTP